MQEIDLAGINCLLEDSSPVGIANNADGFNDYGDEYVPNLDEVKRCEEKGLNMYPFDHVEGEWFRYFYLGEDDSIFDDEQDVNFFLPLEDGGSGEIENFIEIDETGFCDMPEVRLAESDEETPKWLVDLAGGERNYWIYQDAEKYEAEMAFESELILEEIRRSRDERLPDCRIMTVKTKRGKGLYEYVSVRSGTLRTARSGRVYPHEIRFPIVRGEVRSPKSGKRDVDSMVMEELSMAGVPKEERSADLLLEIVKRQAIDRV